MYDVVKTAVMVMALATAIILAGFFALGDPMSFKSGDIFTSF